MENWKKIDNYDNYMISNLGNILFLLNMPMVLTLKLYIQNP